MQTITHEEFSKIEMRVGTITHAENVPKSEKLIKLTVDFGPLGEKQILTAMQPFYKAEEFIGMQTVFVFNLEPRKMMGMESQGMILSIGTDDNEKPIFITPKETVENGDRMI